MPDLPRTPRTTHRRLEKRGSHDRDLIHSILDEGLVCHVGFAVDGQPCVLPTTYARMGERLVLHGSPSNRMFRTLASGAPACVTVSLLDGLVRSGRRSKPPFESGNRSYENCWPWSGRI